MKQISNYKHTSMLRFFIFMTDTEAFEKLKYDSEVR